MKRLLFSIIAVIFMATPVFGLEVFFEHREREQLGRGVVYEQNRMMTSSGMLDVHVLVVDMNEEYISLAPVVSSREHGLRETTTRLLSDAGAIAGVNADFFTMARLHSTYYGPMVRDGQVLSLNARTNAYSHDLATFFLDANNNPFFMYMTTRLHIYANGLRRMTIGAYNSVGANLPAPVVISRTAMYDTAEIDARIEDVPKIVVTNDFVTHVARAGETVAVPENGFVILIPPNTMQYHEEFFRIGTHAIFDVRTDINVDFASINTAIGGGSVILRNGGLVPDVGVQPDRRHPRTAVGATHDRRIIMMAVDGRTHSVGVTHAELGALLRRYGVLNAMHLDGGGSTTMVTRSRDGAYSVANTLSDGSQRRVTNALGVFDNAPIGQKVGIVVEPVQTLAVQGVPLSVNVFGVDTWGNRIPLGEEIGYAPPQVPAFLAAPADGFWLDGRYTPLRTGRHELRVNYGMFSATASIYAHALGELQPRHEIISLLEGGRQRLRFEGIATDGTQMNIPEVTLLSVTPAYLGTFEDGYFVAARGGTGYISAVIGAVRAYIPVSIGGFPWPVDMFASHMGFLSTPPEYVSTRVSTTILEGNTGIRLEYSFANTIQTQASYVTFYPALQIPGEPIALRFQAYGDNSGHWLRGRVRDGDGNFHNIDFARTVDFYGWQTVTARLPNAPAPFAIDRIYTVALEQLEPVQNAIFFHSLEALYAPNHNMPVPRGTVFADNLRVAPGTPATGAVYTFQVPRPQDETTFSVVRASNMAVATLTARNGGIQATSIYQWRHFMPMLRASNLTNIVILLDENPKNFTRRMEYELFHSAMTQLRNEGSTVFVVSATGEETTLTMRDNIRYIDLAQRQCSSSTIRFFTDHAGVRWSD
ncbi:MAG: phosphodiester glycosidase family protein [Defluviitaleaceae bacterium]|nr:phosphodiester glycosidase family protein [Defluviitaleaceae bacterium]MCL2262010.1 phosphodiester glycosidase family protein [Defluviitaleaceae bacterium]